VAQLTQEQQRRTELQEEVAQAQLMQHSMHDLTQELEEVKVGTNPISKFMRQFKKGNIS
jgi:hypothetical protein